jgi:hypothetical protein
MKITVSDTPKAFQPVSFTITCETQQELNAWDFLARYTPIQDTFPFLGQGMDDLNRFLNVQGSTLELLEAARRLEGKVKSLRH